MFPLDHSARIKLIQPGVVGGAKAGFSRLGVGGLQMWAGTTMAKSQQMKAFVCVSYTSGYLT